MYTGIFCALLADQNNTVVPAASSCAQTSFALEQILEDARGLRVLKEIEDSSVTSGSCLGSPNHSPVPTASPVCISVVNEEWSLLGQSFCSDRQT